MKKTVCLAAALILGITSLNAEEQPRYTNKSFARLSHLNGNTYVQRAADLAYEEGVVNMPLSAGDRIGTTGGRAEIHLGNGNYMRLDENTKIDLMSLPDREDDMTRVKVWAGNVYLDINRLDSEKSFEIHTADVSCYLIDEGLYRMDIREDGEMEILVFRGLLEVSGAEGSLLLKTKQRMEAADGRFVSRPSRFFAAAKDGFDRWSHLRDSQLRRSSGRKYLPQELEDFEPELAGYGDWVYMSPYGHVWVPRGLYAGWRPYSYGRWVWLPLCGWTWLPSEPWGWAPFHYGRWHWGVGLGWYWIPTSVWGPAWVRWWWDDYYFAWAPLGYWGRPVVIVNNYFYDRWNDRDYPLGSQALTVIHKNQLKAKNAAEVALSQESVKNIGKINLSGSSLPVRPVGGAVSIESLDKKRVIFRNDESQIKLRPEDRMNKSTLRSPEMSAPPRSEGPNIKAPAIPEERRIRKWTETRDGLGMTGRTGGTSPRQSSYGYPSSPEISIKRFSGDSRSSKPSSFMDRLIRQFQGDRSLSGGSTSRGSISRPPFPSSGPRMPGASAHGVSSQPGPSSKSGAVKKKD